ncbi:hypothetical protein [Nocardia farcinica]|uniref:hypothetical protein n=1 Tax=Nocardia farcinica TaxID=37329 RepID=UPI0024586084|nr:hypothetical protein [Nocardia farcinica]
MSDPVTKFVVHYDEPPASTWTEQRKQWNQHAANAWLKAAHGRGLDVTLIELGDTGGEVVAVVEADGRLYDIAHLGRGTELQAKPR